MSKFIVTQSAVSALVSAANSIDKAGAKLAQALRACLPIPEGRATVAEAAAIESAWNEVRGSAAYEKATDGGKVAIRMAMSRVRKAAGYSVGKGGVPALAPEKVAGAPKVPGNSKAPKGADGEEAANADNADNWQHIASRVAFLLKATGTPKGQQAQVAAILALAMDKLRLMEGGSK